jgi:hypothetical protein
MRTVNSEESSRRDEQGKRATGAPAPRKTDRDDPGVPEGAVATEDRSLEEAGYGYGV